MRSTLRTIVMSKWSPRQLGPALALWIDPSDATTMFQSNAGTTAVTDGSVCGFAGDKSGASFNLVSAADDTTRPTWNSNTGLPYLNFDGTNDVLLKTATLGLYAAGAASVFIACRANSPSTSSGAVVEGGTGTDAFVGWVQTDGTTATSTAYQQRNDAAGGTLATMKTSVFANSDVVYGNIDNGATATPYLNGVAATPQTFTRTGVYTINRLALGARVRSSTANWWAGRVYGLICVTRAVTAGEAAKITTYLGAKMGVSL